MLATLALICLPHVAPPAPGPQDPGADRDAQRAFDRDLDRVRAHGRSGRWKRAHEAMLELFEAHRDDPLLRTRWAELERVYLETLYWTQQGQLEFQDLTEGEVVSFSRSGRLELRYRTSAQGPPPWDFLEYEDMWVARPWFSGPCRLEVQARPDPEARTALLGGWDGIDAYIAYLPQDGRSFLRRWQGNDQRRLANGPEVGSEAARFTVELERDELHFLRGREELLATEKPRELFARFGLYGFTDIDEVVLKGQVDREWLELETARVASARREEFQASYDVVRELPDWLVERFAPLPDPHPLPGPPHPDRDEHVRRLQQLEQDRDFQALLDYAEGLAADEATQPVRSWLMALAHAGLGNDRWFRLRLAAVLQAAPDFLPAVVLDQLLLAEGRSNEEQLEAARALVAEHPDRPEPLALLARTHLRQGEWELAQRVVSDAIRGGMSPLAFRAVQRTFVRAALGPEWSEVHEWRTKNYLVRSNVDEAFCFEAAKLLEESYRKWNLHLRRVETPPDFRYRVYLFGTYREYLRYGSDAMGGAPEYTYGVFYGDLRQLLVWDSPDRERVLRTLRHEGFHQYFHALVGRGPTWLDEGLAEYFETTRLERGRWQDGIPIREHLDTLARGNWVPLDRFLTMEHGSFYEDPARNYAQAWALVHFLMHGGKEWRARLDGLLDALASGVAPGRALEQLGPPEELEQPFQAHVLELTR